MGFRVYDYWDDNQCILLVFTVILFTLYLIQGKVEDSNFPQDFTRISEAAAKVIESDCPGNFADIMSETLRNLNENSENIQVGIKYTMKS